jgi:hypothetical protein
MKLKNLDNSPFVMFFSFVYVCIVIVLIFILAVKYSPTEPELKPEAGPSIYITRTDRFLDLNGETVWLLEYTIDGRFQSPAFHSLEAMAAYREYLDTIGKVYRREEEIK